MSSIELTYDEDKKHRNKDEEIEGMKLNINAINVKTNIPLCMNWNDMP